LVNSSLAQLKLNQCLYPESKLFMETVTISASISEKKKVEFFQTIESLLGIVKSQCNDIEIRVKDDNSLMIEIIFDGKDQMEKNFYNNEFTIIKGTVKSLCKDVIIKVNDSIVSHN